MSDSCLTNGSLNTKPIEGEWGRKETKPTITVRIKNVYGNERIYPINFARELEVLTGQKTISRKQVEMLKAMGFQFCIEQDTL